MNKVLLRGKNLLRLQAAILEAEYSFGGDGQLNITIPKRDGESHGELRKRTEEMADMLQYLELDIKKTSVQKRRIIVKEPNQDMGFIFAQLKIPVTWESFAKGISVSKTPPSRPTVNATLISFLKKEANPDAKGFVAALKPEFSFREPTGHVERLLMGDVDAALNPKKRDRSL